MTFPRAINDASRAMIEAEEGKVYFAYDDAVSPPRAVKPGEKIKGTLTIGAGHTGPDVYAGRTITEAQLQALFDGDILSAETTVSQLVTVDLNDSQYGVLVSLAENIGKGAFAGSTLLKLVNTGKLDQVPAELLKWDHTRVAGKLVVSSGLLGRRKREAALWVSAPVSGAPIPGSGTAVGAKPTSNPTDGALGAGFLLVFVATVARFFAGGASPIDYLVAFAALGLALTFLVVFLRKGK